MVQNVMQAPTGALGAKLIRAMSPRDMTADELNKLERDLRKNLYQESWQAKTLEWLRDNVNPAIPSAWRKLVLGHDQHMYTMSFLRARIDEGNGWVHPYNRGLLIPTQQQSPIIGDQKVTIVFRNDIVDNLITEVAAFGDYKFQEVGTGGDASESNADTALTTPSGIAREAGTQVENAANIYESVATITADASETWDEWGIFNIVTAGILMDKDESFSIAVTSSDQVQFTYDITFNAEA